MTRTLPMLHPFRFLRGAGGGGTEISAGIFDVNPATSGNQWRRSSVTTATCFSGGGGGAGVTHAFVMSSNVARDSEKFSNPDEASCVAAVRRSRDVPK